MRCLITAGPTREHLDPVRYLTNGSSGKMGYALAEAAVARGWEVDLVSGPVVLATPVGVDLIPVVSADEMLQACESRFAACDVFIAVAAVADFRPRFRSDQKQTKASTGSSLELEPTVDILKTLGSHRGADQILVGFAAETSDLETKAPAKLVAKGCDWIVGNDVSAPGIGMEADANAVILWGRDGKVGEIGPLPKNEIAAWLLERILPEIEES
ncbi:phosphopantothenoylcysteine decarboxylase [Opitutaceae bacterium]|nr:phosphopantothenoylcysteine decarboxylase [Opitutaceae bacterium]